MKTYNDLYLDTKKALLDFGNENAQFEARQILSFASGKNFSQIIVNKNLYASSETELKINQYISRLQNGEPIAYILNNWEFYGLPFYINSNVLIPRIDTEVIIDTVKELYPDINTRLRILDLCTGSGNIACTLAYEYHNSNVTAIDISQDAIDVCKRNIKNLNLGAQVYCIKADVLNKPDDKLGTFDLIISNPPYIKSSEIQYLDISVKNYEPLIALDGGKDGYDFYRAIIKNYSHLLRGRSYMIFEVGEEQSTEISSMFKESGYLFTDIRPDSAGTDRIVFGRK